MPQRKNLVTISMITDDDTGLYYIGEIDGLLQQEDLREYIKNHGVEGFNNLIKHLSFLQHQVHNAWADACVDKLDEWAKSDVPMDN